MSSILVAGIGFAALLFGASPASAQVLGAAQSFAIVGETVNANGSGSIINGNVGALGAITGFPANATISSPFINHAGDAVTIAARADLLALYNSAFMAPAGATPIGGDNLSIGSGPSSAIGHYTPGRYTNAGGAAIMPTSITLDGAGLYVFTLANSLTASANVILNGVDPCSVFWRVPSQATLNGLTFPGTVVSDGIIALGVGVNVTGRTLTTANGSVTLAGNDTIGGCSVLGQIVSPYLAATTLSRSGALPAGTVGTPMTDTKTLSGGLGSAAPTGTIIFTLFSDALCTNLVFTSAPVTVSGNGPVTSPPFTPTVPGTFHWIATFSGDANNAPMATLCADANETVTVFGPGGPGAAAGIPTLSGWGLMTLMVLVVLASIYRLRRI